MSNTDAGPRLLEAVEEQMRESGTPEEPTVCEVMIAGARLHLRTLTAERIAALLTWRRKNPSDTRGLYARLVVASLCNPAGELALSAADLATVAGWDAVGLEVLAREVVRINHMG